MGGREGREYSALGPETCKGGVGVGGGEKGGGDAMAVPQGGGEGNKGRGTFGGR